MGCYWGEIDADQRFVGVGVAVREALYFAWTLVALRSNPAFLLVDVATTMRDKRRGASPRDAYFFLALYVLAPEKFVMLVGFGNHNMGRYDKFFVIPWIILSTLGGVLGDLCGVLALVDVVVRWLEGGSMLAALAVGYGATTLGALTWAIWLFARQRG
eukprot:COSAG03_NODE_3202_length_2147_cov_0.996094_2_plen_158_part_00